MPSLVGSEMCIRDSLLGSRKGAGPVQHPLLYTYFIASTIALHSIVLILSSKQKHDGADVLRHAMNDIKTKTYESQVYFTAM